MATFISHIHFIATVMVVTARVWSCQANIGDGTRIKCLRADWHQAFLCQLWW